MTLYAEGMAEHDEISPLLGPDVAAWLAGIYIPRLPKIPKLDVRLEAGYTDTPTSKPDVSFGAFYWDGVWLTGFQNASHLMGSWIGREGEGAQAWTTYWFTPKNKLQFNFRHQKVARGFIPDGGTLTDFGVRGDYWVRSNFGLSASVQDERWLFPVIQPNVSRNVTAVVEILFTPDKWLQHAAANGAGKAP